VLKGDDAVIELVEVVDNVPSGIARFTDVPALEICAGGQDNIGKLRFPFHPDRLVHHEFQLGSPVSLYVSVCVVHRGDIRAAVLVVHLDWGVAGSGVSKLEELAFDCPGVVGIAFRVTIQDGFGNIQPRHSLQHGGHCRELKHALVEINRRGGSFDIAGNPPLGIAWEVKPRVHRCPDGHVAHVDSGLAEALHRHQADHGARPFQAGGAAAGAAQLVASSACAKIGFLGSPFPGQRPDVFSRDAGLAFLPLGSFGNVVFLAQDVILPRVKSGCARGNIFLVV